MGKIRAAFFQTDENIKIHINSALFLKKQNPYLAISRQVYLN